MNKDKVIFLDCDGVLNRACLDGDMRYFVPECFHEFQRIVRVTDAKIVLSTSWREYADWEAMLRDFFGAIGITVIGKTEALRENRHQGDCEVRPCEIRRYLDEHKDEIENYVVIDDIDMRHDFPQHCVCTCAAHRIGLDRGWADEAIAILTRSAVNADKPITVSAAERDEIVRHLKFLYERFPMSMSVENFRPGLKSLIGRILEK